MAMIRSLWKSPVVRGLILGLIALEVVVVAWFYGVETVGLKRAERDVTYGDEVPGPFTRKIEMEGLARPPVLEAGAAGMGDDEEVIGVVVDGKARAYRVKALEYPPWHIVNDVIAGVSVSVAHCNLNECTQVYTDREAKGPLDISQAGLYRGEMVVKVDGTLYVHKTGEPVEGAKPLPYAVMPMTRTTWGAWRREHQGTDAFVGVPKPAG
jgi:hypothetical protein